MSDNVEFNIKEFDMHKIGKDKIVLFIGKRHTGKSMLAKDYLYHNQDIPIGTCVSPTDEYNKTFADIMPSMFIHEEFTPELLEKFIHRQKVITKRKKNDPEYRDIDNRAFLIFDDCLYDAKSWVNDKNMRFIFMNGRHVGITFLLTMQYLLGIPPNLRAQCDFIFICKETKTAIKRKLYEYYAGMFPSFDMFNQVLKECTKDYGCLVIDNTTTSDRLEDQVFWYKADIDALKNFKLCDDVFWQAERKNELTDPVDEMHKTDYSKYGARNKTNINVHRLTIDNEIQPKELAQNYNDVIKNRYNNNVRTPSRRNNLFNPNYLYS